MSWTMDLMAYWLNGQVIALYTSIFRQSWNTRYESYILWIQLDTSSDNVTRRISGNYFSDDINDDITLKKCRVDSRYLIIKINDAIFSTRNRGTWYHDYDP